jgi:hypothetical protein
LPDDLLAKKNGVVFDDLSRSFIPKCAEYRKGDTGKEKNQDQQFYVQRQIPDPPHCRPHPSKYFEYCEKYYTIGRHDEPVFSRIKFFHPVANVFIVT